MPNLVNIPVSSPSITGLDSSGFYTTYQKSSDDMSSENSVKPLNFGVMVIPLRAAIQAH